MLQHTLMGNGVLYAEKTILNSSVTGSSFMILKMFFFLSLNRFAICKLENTTTEEIFEHFQCQIGCPFGL